MLSKNAQSKLVLTQVLDDIGSSIGYGEAQSILGSLWEKRHDCKPRGSMGVTVKDTPSSEWSASSKDDPHGKLYDCPRSRLALGNFTDDQLANAAFMFYDVVPPIQDVLSGQAKMPIVYMTAVKDRIRWLSRRLQEFLDRPTQKELCSFDEKALEIAKQYVDAADFQRLAALQCQIIEAMKSAAAGGPSDV